MLKNNEIIRHRKRGKPANESFNRENLLVKLREISLVTDETLNANKLEKLTGIKRRNWNKVKEEIDYINHSRQTGMVDTNTIRSFPLPNIEEIFQLYFPQNPKKLKEIFQSLIDMVSKMYEKVLIFEKTKENAITASAEQAREIERLRNELKQAKADIEYYKTKYDEVCGDSTYHSKREILNIPKNVIHIPKGQKKLLTLDFQEQFGKILLDSNKEIFIKKND